MKHAMRQRKRHALMRVFALNPNGSDVLYYTHPTHRWPNNGYIVAWRPRLD